MKAVLLHEQPGILISEDVNVDKPGYGEVLVRTAYTGLCHSDLLVTDGVMKQPLPLVPGHEPAGVVEAVGEGVTNVVPGDHVLLANTIYCGTCTRCLSGRPHLCTNFAATERSKAEKPRLSLADGTRVHALMHLGGFAEYMLVHQNAAVRIPKQMPLDKACLISCGVLSGFGAVVRTAQVKPGSTVCVLGVGGVGLSAIQGARIAGASSIIAVGLRSDGLEKARAFGATATINASEVDDVVAAVREMTHGGVEYSFEAVGLKSTIEQAHRMLDHGGTATVIGMMSSDDRIEIRCIDLLRERKLQGSWAGSAQFRTDVPNLVQMYLDGRLLLDEMVSEAISLDGLNDALATMRNGCHGTRTVVKFS